MQSQSTKILEGLNSKQIEAVKHKDGPVAVIAGAGTGKTKVIVNRFAYLKSHYGVDSDSILTLTFNNKGAKEIRDRIGAIFNNSKESFKTYTLHKFGLLFLRRYIDKYKIFGRDSRFSIVDNNGRKRILKELIKEHSTSLDLMDFEREISNIKSFMLDSTLDYDKYYKRKKRNSDDLDDSLGSSDSSEEIFINIDIYHKDIYNIFIKYQERLKESNLFDFDDLIRVPFQILELDRELREELSKRYQYIMVDEFQDLSNMQYSIIKYLSSYHKNIFAVGDDDQSIYQWRDADPRVLFRFRDDFNAKVVILDINYRSSSEILEVANNLIEHNQHRFKKRLKSHIGSKNPVFLIKSSNLKEEIKDIAIEIKNMIESKNIDPQDIAVLYRYNRISFKLERAFNKLNIPFNIIGSTKFYSREEIQKVLSYLKFIENGDDLSLLKIINTPKRGVGELTIFKIREVAKSKGISLFDAFKSDESKDILTARAKEEIDKFILTIESLRSKRDNLDEFLSLFENRVIIPLKEYYLKMENGSNRVENIDILMETLEEETKVWSNLRQLLDEIVLDKSSIDNSKGVNLMTIHTSKGLEFNSVFLISFGLSYTDLEYLDYNNNPFYPLLEEERRVYYVGLTRAKENLIISYSPDSYKDRYAFIKEMIPKEDSFKVGDTLFHPEYGYGVITKYSDKDKTYHIRYASETITHTLDELKDIEKVKVE